MIRLKMALWYAIAVPVVLWFGAVYYTSLWADRTGFRHRLQRG